MKPLFLITSLLAVFLAGCPSQPLSISTASSLPARVGVKYSQQLTTAGGVAPYVWTIATGSLPEGVTLSSSGLLSGTPKVSGSFSFTIEVTDSKKVLAKVKVKGKVS
jgi:hypothetical protein